MNAAARLTSQFLDSYFNRQPGETLDDAMQRRADMPNGVFAFVSRVPIANGGEWRPWEPCLENTKRKDEQ